MNRYVVQMCTGNQIEWSDVPVLSLKNHVMPSQFPVEAEAQMCWSQQAIHVRMTAREPDILARFTGDLDPVYCDSCLETFLCPIADDGRYFNFEINPNGASYVGFGYGRADRMRLHPENIRSLLSIRTERMDNVWSVRFDIPVSIIRLFMPSFSLQKGHRMRANFYKCGDDIVPSHELMWCPITNQNPDFHQSAFFGDLVLG